jgi:membrane protein required for colicin V production
MSWADYGLMAVIVISVIIGLFRGFLREVSSLLLWISGIMLTLHYLPTIEKYLAYRVSSIYLRYAIIIVAVLILVLLMSWLLGKILHLLISSAGLGLIDRFLGVIFGFLRGIVLVSFLIILVEAMDMSSTPVLRDSVFVKTVQPLANWFASMIPKNFTEKITNDLKNSLKKEGI